MNGNWLQAGANLWLVMIRVRTSLRVHVPAVEEKLQRLNLVRNSSLFTSLRRTLLLSLCFVSAHVRNRIVHKSIHSSAMPARSSGASPFPAVGRSFRDFFRYLGIFRAKDWYYHKYLSFPAFFSRSSLWHLLYGLWSRVWLSCGAHVWLLFVHSRRSAIKKRRKRKMKVKMNSLKSERAPLI